MRERRLIRGHRPIERRQRLAVERERRAVVERPAAEGQQGARRVVRGNDRGGGAKLVLAEARGERAFGGKRAHFLADPAVDRRRRDRILDVPVGAFMLEADRRPHQAGAGRESEPAAAHRPEGQIGLAEPGFGALAALERADDGRAAATR